MNKKTDLQKKMVLLKKLFDSGCVTEKQVLNLDLISALQIPGLEIDDMKELVMIQKSLKKHKLFSYLAGNKEIGEENEDA